MNVLCDLITLVLCYDEIDRFKFNKQKKYYEFLTKVSQLELELNQKVSICWRSSTCASGKRWAMALRRRSWCERNNINKNV